MRFFFAVENFQTRNELGLGMWVLMTKLLKSRYSPPVVEYALEHWVFRSPMHAEQATGLLFYFYFYFYFFIVRSFFVRYNKKQTNIEREKCGRRISKASAEYYLGYKKLLSGTRREKAGKRRTFHCLVFQERGMTGLRHTGCEIQDTSGGQNRVVYHLCTLCACS